MILRSRFLFLSLTLLFASTICFAQLPSIRYTITIPQPDSHKYHVELQMEGWQEDTLVLKLPKWTPGYYQIMDYAKALDKIALKDGKGNTIAFKRISDNTLQIVGAKRKAIVLSYEVSTTRKFVATSYVDAEHAYLIPGASFFYVEGYINLTVQVVIKDTPWNDVVTGLDAVKGRTKEFSAANFDILYDSPILIGNLETLSTFKVRGVEHRFIGYKLGTFDKNRFYQQASENLRSCYECDWRYSI